MRLTLSTQHPRNSAYLADTGEVLYKVDKPLSLGSTIATIQKAVGTINGARQGDSERSRPMIRGSSLARSQGDFVHGDNQRRSAQGGGEFSGNGEATFEGRFAFYAQIEFNQVLPTRFRYNGLDVPVSKFFRKEGWSGHGRGRVFKASDGREYRWRLRYESLDMVTNDGRKTQVVKYTEYRPGLGPFREGRPGSLEIDPICEPILDEILMTFVYCHKLRKDNKKQ